MNSNKLKNWFSRGKNILRLISVVFFLCFVFFGIYFNDLYAKYSDLSLASVTILYVFLTFELLVLTRETRPLPFVNLEFILADKLDKEFIDKYSSAIKKSEGFNNLLAEYSSNPDIFNKNIVFVKVENIGPTNVMDLNVNLKYLKESLSNKLESSQDVEFGILKSGAYSIALIEVFDSPSSNDSFKIINCSGYLTDGNGKSMKEAPRYQNFSKTAKSEYFNMGSNRIIFYNSR